MNLVNDWMTRNKLSLSQAGQLLGGYGKGEVSRWRNGVRKPNRAIVKLIESYNDKQIPLRT